MDEEKPVFIAKSTVKEKYFLSDSWLNKLGEPDNTVPNPHHRSGPPRRLYLEERVIRFIEDNREEYDAWLQKRSRLSTAQKYVAKVKHDKTVFWAQNVEIRVHKLPADLIVAAQRHFEQNALERDDFGFDEGKVNFRGVMAYVRHQKSNYDALWQSLKEMYGRQDAFDVLAERVREACVRKIVERFGPEFVDSFVAALEAKYPKLKGKVTELAQDEAALQDLIDELNDPMVGKYSSELETLMLARAKAIISRMGDN